MDASNPLRRRNKIIIGGILSGDWNHSLKLDLVNYLPGPYRAFIGPQYSKYISDYFRILHSTIFNLSILNKQTVFSKVSLSLPISLSHSLRPSIWTTYLLDIYSNHEAKPPTFLSIMFLVTWKYFGNLKTYQVPIKPGIKSIKIFWFYFHFILKFQQKITTYNISFCIRILHCFINFHFFITFQVVCIGTVINR